MPAVASAWKEHGGTRRRPGDTLLISGFEAWTTRPGSLEQAHEWRPAGWKSCASMPPGFQRASYRTRRGHRDAGVQTTGETFEATEAFQ